MHPTRSQYSFRKYQHSNPYKKSKPPKFRFGIKKIILPGLIVIWLILLVYLPYFRINKITYSGLHIIKQPEIAAALNEHFFSKSKIIPQNNYFLVSENKIADYLQNLYLLNSITVKKTFPHKLDIIIEEKISSAIYDNGSKYYLLDQSGTAVKYLKTIGDNEYTISKIITSSLPIATITTTNVGAVAITTTTIFQNDTHKPDYYALFREFGRFPIIYDTRHRLTVEKQIDVLYADYLKGILDFYNALEKGSVTMINYFTMGEPAAGVTVYTNKPFQIKFNPQNDALSQIENLKTILKSNTPAEYIDLRFGDRVYWK